MKLKLYIVVVLSILLSYRLIERKMKTNDQSRSIAGQYDGYEIKDRFILPESLRRLMDFEQRLQDINVDSEKLLRPSNYAQNYIFKPENKKWFLLKTYWIPAEELEVVDYSVGEINLLMTKREGHKKYYRLIVHPQSEKFYENITSKYVRADDMYGTSTSSGRTLLIRSREGHLFFGKLSLNLKLGGVIRTISKTEIITSVGTSAILDYLVNENKKNPNPNQFKYLRESIGIIPKDFERGGMIIREIPKLADETHALMPLFSIYAEDTIKYSSKSSILKKWILQAKKEAIVPKEWVMEKILLPFAQGWAHSYLDLKIVMEAHAQNVLLEVDKDNYPVGVFYHRDLGGFNIKLDFYKNKAWFKHIPFFTDLINDYHQEVRSVVVVDSLRSYFEGGFLFNLNREYRIVTKDNNTDFRYEFRKILAAEIDKKSGQQLDFENAEMFYHQIEGLEKEGQSGFRKRIFQTCSQILKRFFN